MHDRNGVGRNISFWFPRSKRADCRACLCRVAHACVKHALIRDRFGVAAREVLRPFEALQRWHVLAQLGERLSELEMTDPSVGIDSDRLSSVLGGLFVVAPLECDLR